MECLSDRKLAEIKGTFEKLTYQDGTIAEDRLQYVANRIGEKITDREAKMMIRDIDLDGNGKVEFIEFKKKMEKLMARENENWTLFLAVDSNHDSKLSAEEWKKLKNKVDGDTSDKAVQEWIKRSDKDGDNTISCPEFLQSYKK